MVSSPNHDQQYQQPTSIRQQQYDANYATITMLTIKNVIINNPPFLTTIAITTLSPPISNSMLHHLNHNQHQQQYDNANFLTYSENVTNSPDQQPNVSSPNQNQQYHQHSVASPNHQQQYDASYQQYIYQTAISNNTDSIIPGHNHHQQSSNNNNPDSNNTNHNNNQQSSSADIPPLSLNITINSPQDKFYYYT
ncbi:unnamed protein product [Rhizophagus irregularis]|nr:unnamed protein product [Rhizophagus irregularis]